MAGGVAYAAEALFGVSSVIDGDTIVLDNNETVRYAGIDTPEFDYERRLAQPFAEAARDLNSGLVAGKRIRLEFDLQRRDDYGRLIAYVFADDGMMVNQALVAEGLAFCAFHRPNLKYFQSLLESQREALSAGRGLWRGLSDIKKEKLVGNHRSLRFHTTGCLLGRNIASANRVVFSSRRDALWEGFAPCKRCLDAAYTNQPKQPK